MTFDFAFSADRIQQASDSIPVSLRNGSQTANGNIISPSDSLKSSLMLASDDDDSASCNPRRQPGRSEHYSRRWY